MVDEVDQFMDASFDRLMQCKKVLAFTATMGGRLGSRQLKRKIGNKLQFKEYIPPPPHVGEQLDISRVRAYNFELATKCWDQATSRPQAVEAVKEVIKKMPAELQKQVLIITELRREATTIQAALRLHWEDVNVWVFDADAKKPQTKLMLELIRGDDRSHLRPEVVITTHADAVGVTFFKECCVIMMQQPIILSRFIQNVGRASRTQKKGLMHVAWPHTKNLLPMNALSMWNFANSKFALKCK